MSEVQLSESPHTISYWMASAAGPDRAALGEDVVADVAVVGAGIAGLTTALLLTQSGAEVVLVEGDRVAAGVSGTRVRR